MGSTYWLWTVYNSTESILLLSSVNYVQRRESNPLADPSFLTKPLLKLIQVANPNLDFATEDTYKLEFLITVLDLVEGSDTRREYILRLWRNRVYTGKEWGLQVLALCQRYEIQLRSVGHEDLDLK